MSSEEGGCGEDERGFDDQYSEKRSEGRRKMEKCMRRGEREKDEDEGEKRKVISLSPLII